jgi:uncharacterized protein (DUF433 family)
MIHMRPAVSELRKRFQRRYPLAHASAFLDVDGKELVMSVQEEVRLEKALYLVVVRNNQLVLAPPTERFVQSTDFGNETRIAERLYPLPDDRLVMMDPRRQFGQPVVRSVPTAVIAEQVRAGDPIDMIVGLYELTRAQVESAIRYELIRGKPTLAAA